MNEEIKEILDNKLYFDLEEEDYIKIKDYITNLQEELQKKEAMYDSLAVNYRLAQEENEMYKGSFETMSKNYFEEKSRNEKAIEYINNLSNEHNVFGHYGIDGECKKWLLNILNGDDK